MGCASAPGCQGERAGLSVQLCARRETTELLLGSYHLPMLSLWAQPSIHCILAETRRGGRREVGMLPSIGRRSLSADRWSQIRCRKAERFNLLFSALSPFRSPFLSSSFLFFKKKHFFVVCLWRFKVFVKAVSLFELRLRLRSRYIRRCDECRPGCAAAEPR